MARKLIDISVSLQNDIASDPPGLTPKIEYSDHEQGIASILPFFPGLTKEDLPDGKGWAAEKVVCTPPHRTLIDFASR